MTRKLKQSLAPSTAPKNVVKGLVTGILITLVGTAVMSALIIREMLKESAIGYVSMGILLAASIAAAFVAMKNAERRKGVIAAITGASYAVVLLALNALLYRGGYEGVGVTMLLIAGGSMSAIMLGANQKKKGHGSKRKKKHW